MDKIKKYLKFDFLFPIITIYVLIPVAGQIISTMNTDKMLPVDFEFLSFLGAMFLSLWWILLNYDGTIKTAISWWVRYVIMILPVWILYYCIQLNEESSFVLLSYLLINIVGNLVTGLVGFGLRKFLHNSQLIYVLVAVLCIYVLRPFGMWM